MADRSYPRSTWYIVSASFFAMLSLSGIRTALSYYMTSSLGVSEENTIAIFHTFYALGDCSAIVWGIIADCYIGNFWSILVSTFVSIGGSLLIALSSVSTLDLPFTTLCVLGMFAAAIGSGCKKSCLPAFGGDQFQSPLQMERIPTFFAILFWSTAFGNLIASLVAPFLRQITPCFGKDSCYFIPFGMFFGLLVISNVILVTGRNSLYKKPCEKNLLFRVASCIWEGIRTKLKGLTGPSERQSHWLDASIPNHGVELVGDIKAVMRLTVVFLPLIVFWALFDQQITKWIFQAAKMSGDIGSDSFTLQPDQLGFFMGVCTITLVPLFDRVIYPTLGKFNLLKHPLHRIFIGGLLVVVSFVMTGVLQMRIDQGEEKVHMLWQLPQYFIASVSCIMLDVTGMEFAYSEAPKSMKSTMQAIWFLISAMGNFLIVILSHVNFGNESLECFIHGGVLLLFMILFLKLGQSYLSQKKRNRGTEVENDCLNPNERKCVDEHVL